MLEILNGGLHTTVQDMGRQGGQSLGIPPSGAQDGFALRIANLLAGMPASASAHKVEHGVLLVEEEIAFDILVELCRHIDTGDGLGHRLCPLTAMWACFNNLLAQLANLRWQASLLKQPFHC